MSSGEMSQPELSLEEQKSPDIFSEPESLDITESLFLDETNLTSSGIGESEPIEDVPEWKGISMDEIHKGLGAYGCEENPPIRSSQLHTVLFLLPFTGRGPPKAYPAHGMDKWNVGYVRMPHSSHSLYPIEQQQQQQQSGSTREFRLRWEVIQEKLLQSFLSSTQLEAAILSYNNKYAQRWDFCALHNFFSEIGDEESGFFFSNLLPKIIQLALQLPSLITGAIPLLKRHTNGSISFSQLQVASVLANAFLCTFPRRNSTNPQSEYSAYPYINFNRLFSAYREDKPNKSDAVMEKLKCIFHYFRRVTTKAPDGTITIQRRYIPKGNCPEWDKLDHRLPLLHVTSKGTIETEGAGLLQVDFANKYVGGGVLGWGCVQEEIRFVICPELMVTMLVTEALDDTEALVVSGIERYSNYEGYSNNFTWAGDFVDDTPRDSSGRRRTSLVAIDALFFKQPTSQFSKENMLRELNKAFVGFSSVEMSTGNLPAIATGNWGCGAFRGNPKLKVLLQLMAAAVAGRSMVYFTFGDTNLRDNVADMYWHLVQRNIDIAQLFSLLTEYENSSPNIRSDFYRFLYTRSKIKPSTKDSTPSKESPEFNDSNCKENRSDSRKREIVKEETMTSWLETGNCIANKKDKYDDAMDEEQSKIDNKLSLWEALKERESKSKFYCAKEKTKFYSNSIIQDNKDLTVDDNTLVKEVETAKDDPASSRIDKCISTEKKRQTQIKDYFPSRVS